MEKIVHQEKLLGVIVRAADCSEGYNFISPDDWELQLGFNNYAADGVCKPHEHHKRVREARDAMEVLHIFSGKCILDIYWEDRPVSEHILNRQDTVVLLAGGHGIRMLEPTKIFEVKQGPYVSRELDKRFFDGK